MKFEKIDKEYQKQVIIWTFEYSTQMAKELQNNKDFQKYILNYNYPVKLWKKATKTNDFEEMHEFVNDIIYQYEKNMK